MTNIEEIINNNDYELVLIEYPNSIKPSDMNKLKIDDDNQFNIEENDYIVNFKEEKSKKNKILNQISIIHNKKLLNKKIKKYINIRKNIPITEKFNKKAIRLETIKGIDN